jgi:primosomal protein N' (replication factor Y)
MVQGLQAFKNFITGPAEPVVNRVRNQYLFDVLLKLPKDAQLISNCKLQLQQQLL